MEFPHPDQSTDQLITKFWRRRLPRSTYAYITRLLMLQWTAAVIAEVAKIFKMIVHRIFNNLMTYGNTLRFKTR